MIKKKKEGFTLVELLAVIAILAVVAGFTIYVAINVINSSKEKQYTIAINEVEKNASSYLMENADRLFYLTDINNSNVEYQCLTVENLINYGYFKSDILKSQVSNNKTISENDYVYIERDKTTKTITKSKYILNDEELMNVCNVAVMATGDISIDVEPSGLSGYKDITIIYRVKNANNINDYNYTYSYSDNDVVTVINSEPMLKKIKVTNNGTISANIIYTKDNSSIFNISKNITDIDKTPPVIEIKSDLKKVYGDSFDLYEGVTITDNSGEIASKKVYLENKDITSYDDLSLGDNIVTYKATDKFGNEATASRKITLVVVTGSILIDVTPSELSGYKDVTITYKLDNAIDVNDYYYNYSYSVDSATFVISSEPMLKKIRVTDNGTISANIVYKKNSSLITNSSKEITNIDKIPPVITIKSDLKKVYGESFDLYDGVTVTDNSGVVAGKKVYLNGKEITSYSELSVGDNIVTYKAIDKFGNESAANRRITLVVVDKEFNYKEDDQIYQVEADGTYIISAYGAQGGNSGGLGGYVKAEIPLKKGDTLIINTGGINGYNGGGAYGNSKYNPGGGATTIRYNNNYVVIAAGGGAKGNSETPGDGGNGTGAGGSNVGSGAGISGSNGGGGSNSLNYTETQYKTCCNKCTHCEKVQVCGNQGNIDSLEGTRCWYEEKNCVTDWSCAYCGSYSCNEEVTKKGKSGSGGSNSITSPAISKSSQTGIWANNGYVKLTYKLEE